MSVAKLKAREEKFLLATYDRYPVALAKGKGVYLYDDADRKYLDFLSGIGVNALGYAHPAVERTIADQSRKLIHTSNLFYHPYQGELAARLTKNSGLDRAFFCNSGTEAWEAALKLARAYAREHCAEGAEPKWRVLAMSDAFHGRTFGSLATTGTEKYRAPFAPLMPGVDFVQFNDVEDLRKKFDKTVCAVGLEVVQGEGGIRSATREFLHAAHALTRENGALLICDEIQSGLGRTGKMFAFQHYGVRPDMVTIAKPLAGGLPLGALLTTNAVAHCVHPGMHGTTFGGGPLACRVALAVLDVIEKKKLMAHVAEVGDYFRAELRKLQIRHAQIKDIRGLGLMVGVELDSADLAKDVVRHLLDEHIIINRTHETVLRFLPPFLVTKEHVRQVVQALDRALSPAPSTKTRSRR
jgi:acetylornithine/N-succinyldiaminopimelate aminotransferase